MRLRRPFFAESLNIGRPEVVLDLAASAGLDADRIAAQMATGQPREAVLAEARLGQEQFHVRGTPTIMLASGAKLRYPIAYARMRDERVAGVMPLPCRGDECLEATRALFQRAVDESAPADAIGG